MSTDPQGAVTGEEPGIEQGTYEVIRDRLLGHGRALSTTAKALNEQRIEIFGGAKLEVLGSQRMRTENNCVPRDILAVGDRLLLHLIPAVTEHTRKPLGCFRLLARRGIDVDEAARKRHRVDRPSCFHQACSTSVRWARPITRATPSRAT